MSAALDSASAKGRRAASRIVGRNRQFLPAALEILETPPSPLPVAMMMTICAFFALAFIWSFFGRLDVNAIAPGKLEAVGRVKVIQSLDPGKVAAIRAENGARVKAGDIVLELDPAEALADERGARVTLEAGVAEIARRRLAIEIARTAPTAAALEALAANSHGAIAFEEGTSYPVRLREEAVLRADLDRKSVV